MKAVLSLGALCCSAGSPIDDPMAANQSSPVPGRIRNVVDRLLGLADAPTDADDGRLRKRVGVIAGYIIVILPLQVPLLGRA